MKIHVLAESSREATNLSLNGAISCLIAGLVFFAIGIIAGWLIWRRFRSDANRLEKENKRLLEAYERRERTYIENKERITGLLGLPATE